MDFESEYETIPTAGTAVHMTAGAIAGIMEHCIMYPLDVVKTRMQSMTPNPRATYRGVSDGLYKIMRYEGMLRPVRGMSAMIGGAGPAHALYFSCYEKMKQLLSSSRSGHHHIAHGASGCVATLFHDAIMGPADVIKQRMQMYNSPYRNCMDCVRSTYRAEGIRAFYRSYTTQLLMNVPFACIHFMTYEFMQDLTNTERHYDPKAHMASGAVAGGVAAAITTPLDVCKTLLNTQEVRLVTSRTGATGAQQRVDGLLSALRCVYHCRGFRGYFQGLQARVLFQMPSTAIAWSTYEFFKFFLGKQQQVASTASSSHHGHHEEGPGGGGGGAPMRLPGVAVATKGKATAVEGVTAAKPSHYANVLFTSSEG